MNLIFLLFVIVIIAFGIVGGLAITGWLWLALVVALILAIAAFII